jgi:hypothetical protein
MKKKQMLAGLMALLVACCFLLIGFSAHDSAKKEKSTCCNQKIKNCMYKTNCASKVEIFPENFSWQFLSITP